MKKAKRTLLALLMTAAMTVSSIPVTANSQVELEPIQYIDKNNISHTLVTKYTDDMDIPVLIEKIGEISPVLGLKAEYAGVFDGVIEDKFPFSYTNDFVSLEDDTIYMTDMLIYNTKDENGKKAFAVKFPQSTDLYKLTNSNDVSEPNHRYIDEKGVEHLCSMIDTYTIDMTADELIDFLGDITVNGDWKFSYQGKYNGTISDYTARSGNSSYYYDTENDILYYTGMTLYFIRDDNGEKAYAVKFRQFPDLYLYTVKEQGESSMVWTQNYISETAGTTINYWENRNVNDVSLDNADIEEINEKIGDIIIQAGIGDDGFYPSNEYTFAGKFDHEVDLGKYLQAFDIIEYRYDNDTNTLYHAAMGIRMVELENGEEAFLIKLRKNENDSNFYLYTLSRELYEGNSRHYDIIMNDLRYYILVDDGTGKYITKNNTPSPVIQNNSEPTDNPQNEPARTTVPADLKYMTTTQMTTAAFSAQNNNNPTTIPAFEMETDPLQKAVDEEVTVTEVNDQTLLVRSDNGNGLLTMPVKYLDSNIKPYVGMKLIVTYNHGICETWPAQFGNILKVTPVNVKGDANLDFKLDMSDAVLIMQSIANPDKYKLSEEGRENADMDGNGVTNADALAIQKKLLKID